VIRNEGVLARTPRHGHALRSIVAGIEAAHPQRVVDAALDLAEGRLAVGDEQYRLAGFDDVVVLGGGKPAGQAATALETLLGDRLDGGVVVTDAPTGTDRIDVVKGTHPLPSGKNVEATRRLLDRAAAATADDLALVVIGGGGSALLCGPAGGLSVEAYRTVTDRLLASGATIDEINAVRKHLSAVKGGQLARELAPATAVGLVFSDVVGDPLDVIASGPTAPDPTTYADALDVLDRYDVAVPESVGSILERGRRGDRPETPVAGDPALDRVHNHVLANNRTALDAAADACWEAGYSPAILSAGIEGEASDVGGVHAAIARSCLATGEPFEPPVALLSGGETTVTVRGDGRGGPNQEFALAAAVALAADSAADAGPGDPERDGTGVILASVDTDGIDGSTDAAGALVDGTAVADSGDARGALADNDAYTYLADRDALVRTGPTGTNVNDLRVVLVGDPGEPPRRRRSLSTACHPDTFGSDSPHSR
jgi:hydroxypyruvate reductase